MGNVSLFVMKLWYYLSLREFEGHLVEPQKLNYCSYCPFAVLCISLYWYLTHLSLCLKLLTERVLCAHYLIRPLTAGNILWQEEVLLFHIELWACSFFLCYQWCLKLHFVMLWCRFFMLISLLINAVNCKCSTKICWAGK